MLYTLKHHYHHQPETKNWRGKDVNFRKDENSFSDFQKIRVKYSYIKSERQLELKSKMK